MSYRAGSFGLEHIGIPSGEPRIICDGCGMVHYIEQPPRNWFLDGKAKPGWAKLEVEGKRLDYCPACKVAKVRELLGATTPETKGEG